MIINRKKNKNNADYLDKENGVGSKSGRKNIRNRAVQEAAAEGKGRFSQWKAGRKAVNAEKARQNANYGQRLAGAMAIGAIEGGKVGAKAENLKGAFSAGKGVIGTKDGKSLGLQGKSIGATIAGGLSDVYNLETDKIFGDSTVRREQREARELEQKRSDFVNPKYRNSMVDNSNNGGYDLTGALKQGKYNSVLAPELDKYGITGIDDVRDTLATLAMKPNCKITGFNATEHELSLSDGSTMKISGNAGKVLNDGGQANIEQMYLNRGNQVLSEREQYNNAISSIQSAINESVSANASLRAFSVNMPDGGKIDLSFRSIDELSSKIAQSKSVVDAGAPNSQDYQRDGTVDKEAFSRAQLNFQNNYAIYDSLTSNQSVIKENLKIAGDNDEAIKENRTKIEELKKAIKDNKMDEVVESLASAVKVNNVNNIEGIKEGVSKETSKRAERIKDSKESGKKSE